MEIPDPPSQHACAQCSEPLRWLYSPRKTEWVAFVIAAPNWRPHDCVPRSAKTAPNPDYLAARAALGKTETRTDEEQR